MDSKAGILVLSLLVGCFAFPAPEDDLSQFFYDDHNTRIIGGSQAGEGSHPHMVAMTSGLMIRSFMCGGSLISRRSVLTAAHCLDSVYRGGQLTDTLRVTVGTYRWNSGGNTYQLERNVTHPHYVRSIIKNDIALLITTTEVVLNNLVQVIPVSFQYVAGDVPVRVAGWGRTVMGGPASPTLMEITTTTVEGEECVELAELARIELNQPNTPDVEPHIEICTLHSPNVGNCHGDSGSALVNLNDKQQIGVVSWGFPCALGAPDLYVRVSAYEDWLNTNIV